MVLSSTSMSAAGSSQSSRWTSNIHWRAWNCCCCCWVQWNFLEIKSFCKWDLGKKAHCYNKASKIIWEYCTSHLDSFFILLNLTEFERICREAKLFPNAAAIGGPSCRGSARTRRRRWDWAERGILSRVWGKQFGRETHLWWNWWPYVILTCLYIRFGFWGHSLISMLQSLGTAGKITI